MVKLGAGDAFATGVISALLEGSPLADATARGNMLDARVVRFPGDCDGLLTAPDSLASCFERDARSSLSAGSWTRRLRPE